jgi:hypothetical protein
MYAVKFTASNYSLLLAVGGLDTNTAPYPGPVCNVIIGKIVHL